MPRQKSRVERYEPYRQQLREQQLRRPLTPPPPPIDPWYSRTNEFETDLPESSRFDTSVGGDFEQASGVTESRETKSDDQSPRMVIGIDYGTTYTGVSWCWGTRDSLSWDPDMKLIENWPWNGCHEKIPSPIYYKAEKASMMDIESWPGSESTAEPSAVRISPRSYYLSALASSQNDISYKLAKGLRFSIDPPISPFLSDREQDLKDIRASFIEKGEGTGVMGIRHKRRRKRHYERCAALHARKNSRLAFVIPSLLGGVSALSMFALDCRLQGQFDRTPPHWTIQMYPQHIIKWLEDLSPQTAVILLLGATGSYSGSAGYLYYKQRQKRHNDKFLILGVLLVSLGCMAVQLLGIVVDLNDQDMVFKIFPGIVLLALLATNINAQLEGDSRGTTLP